MRWVCLLLGHRLADAHWKDFVKSTGMDLVFWTSGVQKGLCRCERCGAEVKAWREGFCGPGGSAGKWRRMSEAKEREIDSLPRM
jgi:hypothetical protein